jgi:hypothetical protein
MPRGICGNNNGSYDFCLKHYTIGGAFGEMRKCHLNEFPEPIFLINLIKYKNVIKMSLSLVHFLFGQQSLFWHLSEA